MNKIFTMCFFHKMSIPDILLSLIFLSFGRSIFETIRNLKKEKSSSKCQRIRKVNIMKVTMNRFFSHGSSRIINLWSNAGTSEITIIEIISRIPIKSILSCLEIDNAITISKSIKALWQIVVEFRLIEVDNTHNIHIRVARFPIQNSFIHTSTFDQVW